MPRDMSSSSSEDEADVHTTNVPEQQNENAKKASRYQCPDDFVRFSHNPCSSTLTESLKNSNKELWLIKAPANFTSESFRNIKVPLSGLQTVKVPTQTGSNQQIYSLLASSHGVSELCLLTGDKPGSDNVVFGPTFSGLLNVCENYGDSSANQTPHVIPAAPAPSIPPGLKQRFHPFGSKTPTLTSVAESEADGAVLGPSSTTLRPLVVKRFVEETWQEEQGEEGRKKKKKKKDKSVKTERLEVYLEDQVRVKVEPVTEIQEEVMMELPTEEGDVVGEKRKKKKKKKDREREEVEEGIEPSVRVKVEPERVKTEPIDILYGDVTEESGRKKKKKKKNRTDDD